MSLTKVTYSMIDGAPVNVDDFGAVGNGVTDDTAAIQAALSSGASEIVFSHGRTYLVNGNLTCSTANVLISAYGATIRLKNNASNTNILSCTGDYAQVAGGTWDMNRANGNTGVNPYLYWAILIDCDYGIVKETVAKSSYGAGLLGRGNYLTFQNNTVSDCIYWGIFITALPATFYYGNKAIGNVIDSSASIDYGQGILFSSTGDSTGQQRDWVLSNNIITGPQGAGVVGQCICLAVRGERGVVANNVTRYGAMGFSEGGDDTVVTGNVFSELQGTISYGIEPSGRQTITANYAVNCKRGINAGIQNTIYDGMVITGNTFITTDIAIQISPIITDTANDLTISGNYLYAPLNCISLVRTCDRATITGNTMVGNGTGNGVFLNTPSLAPFVFVSSNTFKNIVNPIGVFNVAPLRTYTDLFASSNNFSGCTNSDWTPLGTNAIGARVSAIGNVLTNGTVTQNTIDTASKWIEKWGTGTPEGVVAAGVGSIFHRTDGAAGTSLYIKEAGASTTGWVAK